MKKKKGFTLIELFIGLAILATGFLMILGVFPVSMKSVKQGKDVLFATHLAQQQMEKAIYQCYGTDFLNYGLSIPDTTTTVTSTVNNVPTTTGFIYSVTFDPDGPPDDNPSSTTDVSKATVKTIVVLVYACKLKAPEMEWEIMPERSVKLETDVAREE